MGVFTIKRIHPFITATLFIIAVTGSALWFLSSSLIVKSETRVSTAHEIKKIEGKRIIVHLTSMTLDLENNGTLVETLPIISKGKPGSYYETIGGSYENDYKVPLHLSSIGHVYMPYSVHIFGNYFIHGIPYYPDGKEVSSTYSGGCVRLANSDAKKVYDFVEEKTPIILTQDTLTSFSETPSSTSTLSSLEMTNLMVATISLEALSQDNTIIDTDGQTMTTRRSLLTRLLVDGDSSVAKLYTKSILEENFVALMNQKAQALGMTNTSFTDAYSPVVTTYEDYDRFMNYIGTYKSYLRTLNTRN